MPGTTSFTVTSATTTSIGTTAASATPSPAQQPAAFGDERPAVSPGASRTLPGAAPTAQLGHLAADAAARMVGRDAVFVPRVVDLLCRLGLRQLWTIERNYQDQNAELNAELLKGAVSFAATAGCSAGHVQWRQDAELPGAVADADWTAEQERLHTAGLLGRLNAVDRHGVIDQDAADFCTAALAHPRVQISLGPVRIREAPQPPTHEPHVRGALLDHPNLASWTAQVQPNFQITSSTWRFGTGNPSAEGKTESAATQADAQSWQGALLALTQRLGGAAMGGIAVQDQVFTEPQADGAAPPDRRRFIDTCLRNGMAYLAVPLRGGTLAHIFYPAAMFDAVDRITRQQ